MEKKIETLITIINKFIQSYSNFDINTIVALVEDNFSFKNISHGEIVEETQNIIEFGLVLEQSKILFSTREIEIQNLNINNSIIEAQTLINATMAIGTPDKLRAGQKISFKAKFVFYIVENKIAKLSLIS